MDTSEPARARVGGQLRSSFDEPVAPAVSPRPGSNTFGRMPPPAPLPALPRRTEPPPGTTGGVPIVRRRRRLSGMVIPVVVAAAGCGGAYGLFEMAHSLPLALVCGGVGLVGAWFCLVLLRDRVEIA